MPILGFDAKLYRLTTGTRATWNDGSTPALLTEVTNVKDLTRNQEDDEVDTTTRADGGYETVIGGLRKSPVDFKMVAELSDADYLAFRTKYAARQAIALGIFDGDVETAGVQGLWADFAILKFVESQPINGVVEVDVSVKPRRSAVAPELITIGGS